MSEPRVIQADYANWRTVAGRKVLQLVFEVPIEQTADVMAKLGIPIPGESRWCAIALLESPEELARAVPEAPAKGEYGLSPITLAEPNADRAEPQKDRRPFASLPFSQQAAIRCGDASFQEFVANVQGSVKGGPDMAANFVRQQCGVQTRAALDHAGEWVAQAEWREIEHQYQAWLTDQRYAGAKR